MNIIIIIIIIRFCRSCFVQQSAYRSQSCPCTPSTTPPANPRKRTVTIYV